MGEITSARSGPGILIAWKWVKSLRNSQKSEWNHSRSIRKHWCETHLTKPNPSLYQWQASFYLIAYAMRKGIICEKKRMNPYAASQRQFNSSVGHNLHSRRFFFFIKLRHMMRNGTSPNGVSSHFFRFSSLPPPPLLTFLRRFTRINAAFWNSCWHGSSSHDI